MAIEILHNPVDEHAVRWVIRRAHDLSRAGVVEHSTAERLFRMTRHILRERPAHYLRHLEAFAERAEAMAESESGQTRRAAEMHTARVAPQEAQVFREMLVALDRDVIEDAFIYSYAAVAQFGGLIQ